MCPADHAPAVRRPVGTVAVGGATVAVTMDINSRRESSRLSGGAHKVQFSHRTRADSPAFLRGWVCPRSGCRAGHAARGEVPGSIASMAPCARLASLRRPGPPRSRWPRPTPNAPAGRQPKGRTFSGNRWTWGFRSRAARDGRRGAFPSRPRASATTCERTIPSRPRAPMRLDHHYDVFALPSDGVLSSLRPRVGRIVSCERRGRLRQLQDYLLNAGRMLRRSRAIAAAWGAWSGLTALLAPVPLLDRRHFDPSGLTLFLTNKCRFSSRSRTAMPRPGFRPPGDAGTHIPGGPRFRLSDS